MCRWSSMSRREKCRCISLVILALIAIAGVVAMIWGSVAIWRVSKDGLAADGGDVMTILNPFVKCGNVQAPTGDFQYDVVRHALEFQCMAAQLPPRLVSGFASAFMILALLCAPCAFKKDKMFGFTLWSTLAIVMIVMSAAIVSVYALPAASRMAPNCGKYDQATIQELQTVGVVCLKGVPGVDDKTTALKWLCKLHMFYAGSIVCIVSLLLLFMCKHCCCCKSGAAGAGAGCCPSQQAAGVNGEHPCPIRRALCNFKARFCRRSAPLASAADQDSSLPVSAPSYYQVHESSSEGASEDAGASSANNYYGVN